MIAPDVAAQPWSPGDPLPIDRRRLRWRSRRGLLENDLLLTRFLDAHEATLRDEEVTALTLLLRLPDGELLDLLLQRTEPKDAFDNAIVKALLERLRNA